MANKYRAFQTATLAAVLTFTQVETSAAGRFGGFRPKPPPAPKCVQCAPGAGAVSAGSPSARQAASAPGMRQNLTAKLNGGSAPSTITRDFNRNVGTRREAFNSAATARQRGKPAVDHAGNVHQSTTKAATDPKYNGYRFQSRQVTTPDGRKFKQTKIIDHQGRMPKTDAQGRPYKKRPVTETPGYRRAEANAAFAVPKPGSASTAMAGKGHAVAISRLKNQLGAAKTPADKRRIQAEIKRLQREAGVDRRAAADRATKSRLAVERIGKQRRLQAERVGKKQPSRRKADCGSGEPTECGNYRHGKKRNNGPDRQGMWVDNGTTSTRHTVEVRPNGVFDEHTVVTNKATGDRTIRRATHVPDRTRGYRTINKSTKHIAKERPEAGPNKGFLAQTVKNLH